VDASSPPQVEFEHRRLKPGVVPPSLVAAQQKAGELGKRMSRRAKIWRGVFVVAGAAAIAFATQRAGMELQSGLCFFLAALPVLWVGGWLFGFLFSFFVHARTAKGEIRAHVGSMNWQQELAQNSVVEKVKMTVLTEGLELLRDADRQLVPWAAIKLDRVDAKTLAVYLLNESSGLAMNEALPVPRVSFASDEAFDAFCLEAQKHVWEAQRLQK
jgi:hypothetical protein